MSLPSQLATTLAGGNRNRRYNTGRCERKSGDGSTAIARSSQRGGSGKSRRAFPLFRVKWQDGSVQMAYPNRPQKLVMAPGG